MSPFGEIRSALDMLNLHVVKVDNIVPEYGHRADHADAPQEHREDAGGRAGAV